MSFENFNTSQENEHDQETELRIKELSSKIAALKYELMKENVDPDKLDPEIAGMFRASNKTDMLREKGEGNAA